MPAAGPPRSPPPPPPPFLREGTESSCVRFLGSAHASPPAALARGGGKEQPRRGPRLELARHVAQGPAGRQRGCPPCSRRALTVLIPWSQPEGGRGGGGRQSEALSPSESSSCCAPAVPEFLVTHPRIGRAAARRSGGGRAPSPGSCLPYQEGRRGGGASAFLPSGNHVTLGCKTKPANAGLGWGEESAPLPGVRRGGRGREAPLGTG